MIRTAVHLSETQHKELQEESKRTGLKIAEMIRRAIDEYLDKHRKEQPDVPHREA